MARGMRRGDGGIRISQRYLPDDELDELDEDIIISLDGHVRGARKWHTQHQWVDPLTGDEDDK